MNATLEKELIADILQGDDKAFAMLVKRYHRPIFNMLLRMTGCPEDAADLAQETFLKAFEHLAQFRTSNRFFPWLYTIGLNTALDHMRRQRRAAEIIISNSHCAFYEDAAAQAEQNLLRCLDASRLPELLTRLPEEYRQPLMLRFYEGLRMKEIGGRLGISASGAKMRVKRGLEKLRAIMTPDSRRLRRSGSHDLKIPV